MVIPQINSYATAMNYIKELCKFGSNYGLTRTERILEIMDNPHKKIKTIHIAGTNGKGSTTAMVSNMLIEGGYKVGMYTSPYLEEFEERIQINNENIPKDKLVNIVKEVASAVSKVIEEGYEHPTEFEVITCVMFKYFCDEKVDYGVIEVGLGGRLDSTNVINPIVSVIASISYDHMGILGDNLGDIAREKAGIIKKGVPVVSYPQKEEAEKVIMEKALELNCDINFVSEIDGKFAKIIEEDGIKQVIFAMYRGQFKTIKLGLLGSHQILNCALALRVIEILEREENIEIDFESKLKALSEVKWKGRLEVMNRTPLVVIDGAHNIDGIKKLKESVQEYFNYDNIILVLGILADKEVDKMIKEIAPMAKKIIAVTPHSDRAALSKDLKLAIEKVNSSVEAIEDYKTAYAKALQYAGKKDLVVISGSLYMIGDMRKIIKNS